MKYTATSPVTVQPHTLVRLTKAQQLRCAALVKPAAEHKGWHEVVHAFQFKVGETFELDAELPKSMADLVEGGEAHPAKPTRADRAAASADEAAAAGGGSQQPGLPGTEQA